VSEGGFGPLLPRERRARRRRPRLAPWALRGAVALVVFAGGGTRTYVRTLAPETLPPETATVTVTAP
jgi:hypothetical protein